VASNRVRETLDKVGKKLPKNKKECGGLKFRAKMKEHKSIIQVVQPRTAIPG